MSSWSEQARQAIYEVHQSLPDNVTLEDRIKAVDDAYPFGIRQYHPYKMWLKVRREYLARYGYKSKGKPEASAPLLESPLDRQKRLAEERLARPTPLTDRGMA